MAETGPAVGPARGPAVGPRLVATDLDGTLLRSDGTLSALTARVLSALDARGVAVVLVTARPLRWMDALWPHVGAHGIAVVSNGAVTWDVAAGRPLDLHPFAADLGRRVVDRVAALAPGAGFGVERLSGLARDAVYEPVDDTSPGLLVAERERLWDEPGLKLLVQDREADPVALRAAVAEAVGDDAVATWTLPGLVEVSAAGVTKGAGLARVAQRLGISAPDVVAFGDMPNDLPMLAWAGRGCAVANAHDDVRAAADVVVGACDDDGVAQALIELFSLPSAVMDA